MWRVADVMENINSILPLEEFLYNLLLKVFYQILEVTNWCSYFTCESIRLTECKGMDTFLVGDEDLTLKMDPGNGKGRILTPEPCSGITWKSAS